MNWTGGRLFRHSFKNKSTRKAREKLHFAKVRRSANKSQRGTLSPFRVPVPAPSATALNGQLEALSWHGGHGEGRARNDDANPYREKRGCLRASPKRSRQQSPFNGSHRFSDSKNSSNRPTEQASSGPPGCQPENLEDVRQKLLQRNDWANLSTSRPLNVQFTTEEERYNYGRRRPLTKADQRRIVAPEKRRAPIVPGREWSLKRRKRREAGDDTSTLPNIDDISIRINQQKLSWLPERLRSESQAASKVSSESMLLDQEEQGESNRAESSAVIADPRSTGSTDVFRYANDDLLTACEAVGSGTERTPVNRSSFEHSQLPELNRCGSFTRDGYRTKYVPPSNGYASASGAARSPAHLPPDTPPLRSEAQTMRPLETQRGSLLSQRKIPRREVPETPVGAEIPPVPTETPVRTFFGQKVEESPTNFLDEDEIWKRLIFKPRRDEIEMDDKLRPCLFKSKETADLGDMSSIHEDESNHIINLAANLNSPTNSETFQTAANTSLNWVPSPEKGDNACSETDFLSQCSPMEGYIDEFLSDISMHNNATNSNQSLELSSPEATTQRRRSFQDIERVEETPCIDPEWLTPRYYRTESSPDPLSLAVNDFASAPSFISSNIHAMRY